MSVLTGVLHLDGATGAVDDVTQVGQPPCGWDDAGSHAEGPVAFRWQVRWTTPEAATERQPVTSADRRFVLSYSGRIDNRDELIARFGVSATATDGALLAAALSDAGVGGLRHCVGDFVLAAWDRVAHRLWLARDALGHRPLFYVSSRERVVWSTDLSVLRNGVASGAHPNPGFLAEYLSGSVMSLGETVFDTVRRVPPAHALSIGPGESAFRTTEYWTPPQSLPARRSDEELIGEFHERFSAAMRAALRVSGTVAAELSGGLDSSSIVALAKEITGVAPATYSMVFPGAPFTPDGERLDESPFIDAMVAAVGASSHRSDPRTTERHDALRILQVHGDLPDRPNADLVRWPMVRAAAASGHRVMLTGVGGDQWLTGSVARLPKLLRRGHLRDAWRFLRAATAPNGLEALGIPVLRRIAAAAAPAFVRDTFRYVRPARPWPRWLREDFVRRSGLAERLRAMSARVPRDADAVLRDSLSRLASAEGPLTREGMFRTAADAGMEVRHPFFDRRLVEFVLTLPDDLRFRHGHTRYILRQSMGTRLPTAIVARRDKGDGTILATHALTQVLAGMSLTTLRVADAGWVDGDRVRKACASLISGTPAPLPRPEHFSLWEVVAVEAWLRALDSGVD